MKKKKIGEILLGEKLISDEQLESALLLQKGKNKRLGKVLIEMGFVTEEQVALALSRQLNLQLIKFIDPRSADKEALKHVPKDIAEKRLVFPYALKDTDLTVAMADPLDWQTLEEITFRTGLKTTAIVATESAIISAVETVYGSSEQIWDILKEIPTYGNVEIIKDMAEESELEDKSSQTLFKISEAPPIVKLVTMIIVDAVKSRASDVHIEPRSKYVQVRHRVDGELRNVLKFPKHIQDAVISRIKIISKLDITNRRLPQDGRSTIMVDQNRIEMRISTLPSVYGEKIVIRLLDSSKGLIPLGTIGIPPNILNPLMALFSLPQGLVLITGPTGSGKTTTLYAILMQLRTESDNIISIEDPVEYRLAGVTQVGINEAIGLSFPAVLRSVFRQDPDIIFVGEIRDSETAEITIRAALTGHLVMSTMHTNDTISAITRLIDIGIAPYLLSSAITGVLAQRLVKRICDNCKIETDPPTELAIYDIPPLKRYYKGTGCNMCQYTGYRGQVGVYEFLSMTPEIRRLISKNASEEELWDAARASGTRTLFDDSLEKIENGVTTVEEVVIKIPHKAVSPAEKRPLKEHAVRVLLFGLAREDERAISSILEPEGFEIGGSKGADIMEAMKRFGPDLIVTNSSDDDFDRIRTLKRNIRGAYTPVLAIRDATDADAAKKGAEAGVKEFLIRPIDREALLRMIENSTAESSGESREEQSVSG